MTFTKVLLFAAPAALLAAFAASTATGPIRFEEVSAQAGIQFTHSYGAEKLGSLLESTSTNRRGASSPKSL